MPQSDFWPFNKSIRASEDVEVKGEPSVLQKQLGDMEGEVKEIQMELEAIKKDRRDLVSMKQHTTRTYETVTHLDVVTREHNPCDTDNRLPELCKLREELIKAKKVADEERIQREKYEDKLKDLETKLNDLCSPEVVAEIKESRCQTNGEVASLKLELRDMKDEIEELKITVYEKSEQLQDYRMRYLQAQQQVEEAKRQRDVIEIDNKQVSDLIQMEIQKMKMQFQEKLQELAPLPDLLKGAQIQLQEAKQLQKLAEENSQHLSVELHRVREKLVMAVNSLNQEKVDRSKLAEENKIIKLTLVEKEKEIDVISKDLNENKVKVCRFEEKLLQQEARFKEKATECSHLLKDFEGLRVESGRSLNRSKERAESMRRYMQAQISELERQLVQSRAQCRSCQKERDEIRQRMQIQITTLQENFELVEIRLTALQSQVASLKNSYTVILTDEDDDFNKITNT